MLARCHVASAELEWKQSFLPEPVGFFSLCGKEYRKDLS